MMKNPVFSATALAVCAMMLAAGCEKRPEPVEIVLDEKPAAKATVAPKTASPARLATEAKAVFPAGPTETLTSATVETQAVETTQTAVITSATVSTAPRVIATPIIPKVELPPLPAATLPLDKVPTKDEWTSLTADQACGQAQARFDMMRTTVKPGEYLSMDECRDTCMNLEGYLTKVAFERGSMDKDNYEDCLLKIRDACSDLTEAANINETTKPEDVQKLINRAQGYLNEVEVVVRSFARVPSVKK